MYKRYLHKINLFFYSVGMITLGIIILVQGQLLLKPACIIGGIVISINGVYQIINFFANHRQSVTGKMKLPVLLGGLVNLAVGLLTLFIPSITLGFLLLIFSVYVLLNALVKIIDFWVYYRNGIKGIWMDFAAFLFFLTFGIILMFFNNYNQRTLLVISGIYCILYGGTVLNDFIHQIIPNKTKTLLHRKIRISLPMFVSTFVPLRVLKDYQRKIDSREIDFKTLMEEEIVDKNDNAPPDAEVLVHVSDEGVGIMGHCDLYFEGEVLSYGNYDEESSRMMGGLGDGVLFIADKKSYLDYSVEYDNKIIFVYGLRLTSQQVQKIRDEIRRIKSAIYPWKSPYQLAWEKDNKAELLDYKDYCSKLWDGTRADFYKFKKGRFKTYFVMSTNCVLLTDSILSKAGTDIIKTTGIITPGAYYDYLQREYQVKDSIVITRSVYSKYDLKKHEEKFENDDNIIKDDESIVL